MPALPVNDSPPFDTVTAPTPLEPPRDAASPPRRRRRVGVSLFWRTFFMLAALLLGSTMTWYQTFRALEYEPRAIQTAQQIASLVNLSRAALVYSDAIARVSLIKTLAEQERVRIVPREPGDQFSLYDRTRLDERISTELGSRLGPGTVVATNVNGEEGLWVGFSIEGDSYWLLMDPSRVQPLSSATWFIWLLAAGALSLLGAAVIAGLINRPLKHLALAAARVREGDFSTPRLDENTPTREIRAVNIGFNRMADQLAKLEQDRTEMLAGISHDLRTPLARLRLETEMSVPDAEAREHMAADISQLDVIINKFLDYARPDQVRLAPVVLAEVVESCVFPFTKLDTMQVRTEVPLDLRVIADEVELGRVLSNLLENARRYGKTPGSDITHVSVAAQRVGEHVHLRLRDHGSGASADTLADLTKPFFRGNTARTEATGAGLGLAIADKAMQRMGGSLVLANAERGGLAAHLTLRVAPNASAESRPRALRGLVRGKAPAPGPSAASPAPSADTGSAGLPPAGGVAPRS